MYLYGDRYKLVEAWNAVNVPDKDGVFRHGSVIGVGDGGLIIDFDCPGQHSEFVQYEKIFDVAIFSSAITTVKNSNKVKFPKDADIEALIRLRRDHPWTWLPGKIVSFEPHFEASSSYAVVEMQLGGSTVQELLPCGQVRLQLSSKQLKKANIGKGAFVTRSCPLPKNYWASISSVLSGVFVKNLERDYKALPVSVSSESLSYLQRRSQASVEPEQLATLFRWNKADNGRYAYGFSRDYANKEWTFRRILAKSFSEERPGIHNPGGDIFPISLPGELFAEIFQCLETISRIRCRRTCTLWNFILTTRYLGKDVRISLAEKSFSSSPYYDWSPLYAVTGCVLKCISRSTQSLSITSEDHTYTKLSFLDYIRRSVKDSRMERMILYNLKCHINYGSGQSMEKAMDQFVHNCSCCQILTFQDTTLRFVMYRQGAGIGMLGAARISLDAFEVHIPFGSVELNAPDVVTQLWDLVARNCGESDDDGIRQRIAEWIKWRGSIVQTAGAIIEILNTVQSDDPRTATHYRGKKWSMENLRDLNVSKLTLITLQALHTLKRRECPDGSLMAFIPILAVLPAF